MYKKRLRQLKGEREGAFTLSNLRFKKNWDQNTLKNYQWRPFSPFPLFLVNTWFQNMTCLYFSFHFLWTKSCLSPPPQSSLLKRYSIVSLQGLVQYTEDHNTKRHTWVLMVQKGLSFSSGGGRNGPQVQSRGFHVAGTGGPFNAALGPSYKAQASIHTTAYRVEWNAKWPYLGTVKTTNFFNLKDLYSWIKRNWILHSYINNMQQNWLCILKINISSV